MQTTRGPLMLLSELKIGEGYEVRDKSLIGTVKMIIHNGKLKIACFVPASSGTVSVG